jgi:hypothetical protein
MTKEELYQLEEKLKERGYCRHPSINSADYALFKTFGESKHEGGRPNYLIFFNIYDFTKYNHSPHNPYSCSPSVMLSRTIDERFDLQMSTTYCNDIDKVESLAEKFLKWAEQNIEV